MWSLAHARRCTGLPQCPSYTLSAVLVNLWYAGPQKIQVHEGDDMISSGGIISKKA